MPNYFCEVDFWLCCHHIFLVTPLPTDLSMTPILFYRFVAPMVKSDLVKGKNEAKTSLNWTSRGSTKSACPPSLKWAMNELISLSIKENERKHLSLKQVIWYFEFSRQNPSFYLAKIWMQIELSALIFEFSRQKLLIHILSFGAKIQIILTWKSQTEC